MKKLLFVVVIGTFFFSCNDHGKLPVQRIAEKLKELHRDTTVHVRDSFGLVDFNTTKRELLFEEQMRARKKVPQPPPPVVQPPPSGAYGVVYIEFNGALVSGTAYNIYGDITCEPSGLTYEQQQECMDTVSKRYKQFPLIFTNDSNVYKAAPYNKRIKVIATATWEFYGKAGGTSMVGSFTWGDNTPAFVFTMLLNYNTKLIYEAIAHEVGHTLGCRHQSLYDQNCVKTAEYNPGCCGFAPIMGYAYNQPISRWIVGPNSISCTTIQNDTLVIKSTLNK